ncbi:MAG: ABC transporter substrate-binding protein, partial [Xanthomonadales bacterium]|nr:ABC transporter substrate-binding protein [Xanthomonadales bacterium]
HSRALGIELYRGSHAYLEAVNRQGGVHGRRVVIRAYDDGYDPPRAIANTIQLLNDDSVFLLFNYVGTPTVTRVLPLLRQFASEDVFLFFPFTGAEPHRQPPYSDYVFNLRASYFNETDGLVRNFLNIGRSDIAVFYQADAYGRSGWEGVRNALERHGHVIRGEATYRRGASFGESFRQQVEILRDADPDAIISVCSYEACAGLIRDARAANWDVPIANLSFVASEAMMTLLAMGSDEATARNTRNLIGAQVVPSYEDLRLPAVREYRALMDDYGDAIPAAARQVGYEPQRYSFVSFEGYLNARLLVEVLRRLGPEPVRDRIRESAEGIRNIDLGIDSHVFFGPQRHQASNAVYYTTPEDGVLVPLTDWGRWQADPP